MGELKGVEKLTDGTAQINKFPVSDVVNPGYKTSKSLCTIPIPIPKYQFRKCTLSLKITSVSYLVIQEKLNHRFT